MTLPLTSTCVGGRRASPDMPAPVQRAARAATPMPFTRRECQVLDEVIRTGFCIKAAAALGLSHKTVEIHMMHMRTKACMDSNYQLIAAYVTAKLDSAAAVKGEAE